MNSINNLLLDDLLLDDVVQSSITISWSRQNSLSSEFLQDIYNTKQNNIILLIDWFE